MRVLDATLALREGMPVHPGDPPFRLERLCSLRGDEGSDLSALHLSAHAGTHVDAPRHMLAGGAGVDELPLGSLVGPCLVLDAGRGGRVSRAELGRLLRGDAERVLLRTRAGRPEGDPWREGFAALEEGAALLLVERGARLVGIDSPSVDAPGSRTHPVHRSLLSAGVVVVEGLDLSGVPPGRYEVVVAPLKVAGGDGAPARVLLLER